MPCLHSGNFGVLYLKYSSDLQFIFRVHITNILVKTPNPPLDIFQLTFKLSYETMWIFTRGFVCQYSVIQKKEI
jgi:hypothetical protein